MKHWLMVISILVASYLLAHELVNLEAKQCPPIPSKVKVVWYQVNEYPMTIDGVMDGENVRIN